jgi:DnaJ family protein C protein 3
VCTLTQAAPPSSSRAVALNPSSHELLVRLSLISYLFLHESSQIALAPIKQCLHFDPESKLCKSVFRKLKSLDKDVTRSRNFIEASKWREALKVLEPELLQSVRNALALDFSDHIPHSLRTRDSRLLREILTFTCRAHSKSGSTRLASRFCNEVLNYDPNNVDGLVGKGDDLLRQEEYQEAANVYQRAFEEGGRQDREVLDKLQKAQRLLKRSKQKDYYKVRFFLSLLTVAGTWLILPGGLFRKILGVARDADAKTIKKAYRKATLKAHPVCCDLSLSLCFDKCSSVSSSRTREGLMPKWRLSTKLSRS